MLTAPHSLVGLSIISQIPNLWGVLLAFISHFIFDFFLPHWNPHIYSEFNAKKKISSLSLKIIIIDALLGAGFTLIVMSRVLPDFRLAFLFGLGAFASILPDFIEIPFYFFHYQADWLKKYVEFGHKYQAETNVFWGILTQLLVMAAGLKIVFF